MQYLRTNTAVIVSVGPFLDKADGVTLETALTITNERISLVAETDNGSAPTYVLDNVTGATSGTDNDLNYITGQDNAMMQLELSAANTNRLGRMFLTITDAANHCPVFKEFTVLPATIYDQMFAASFPRGPVLASGTLGATGNSTTALHLTGLAYADDDINGNMIVIVDVSTGLAHSTYITDWANTGDLATVPTLPFTPEASVDTYIVLAAKKDPDVATILADTNELQTDWANGGRLDLLLDATLADTAELQTDWTNGGRLDLLLDATLADTNELQTDWANGGRLDLLIDGVKAKTDSLTYTVAGVVDANIQRINDVAITGDGSGTPFDV